MSVRRTMFGKAHRNRILADNRIMDSDAQAGKLLQLRSSCRKVFVIPPGQQKPADAQCIIGFHNRLDCRNIVASEKIDCKAAQQLGRCTYTHTLSFSQKGLRISFFRIFPAPFTGNAATKATDVGHL